MPAWAYALWGLIGVGTIFDLLAAVLIAAFFLRRARPPRARPPVTLLKPLAGEEEGLYDNLRSFFTQDYPAFQIVFGGRPSPAVDRLRQEFPKVEVTVVSTDDRIGPNPKTSNLGQMLPSAHHDLLVVTDSDVRADPKFLDRVARSFEDERVGAATSLCLIPCANPPSALHSYVWGLDKLAFLPIAKLVGALRFGNGCATAVRRSVLEAGGGFEAFADRVGDGYWWPNLASRAGRSVALLDGTLRLTGAPKTWGDMARLQLRYVREQRALEPLGHFFSVLTFGWIAALAYGIADGFSPLSQAMLGASLALRWARPLLASCAERSMLAWLWILPFRDLWSLGLWAAAYTGRKVSWRGREFEIEPGGRLKELEGGGRS